MVQCSVESQCNACWLSSVPHVCVVSPLTIACRCLQGPDMLEACHVPAHSNTGGS